MYIKEAVEINATGRKSPATKKKKKKAELPVPGDLAAALKKNKTAQAAFEKFPPSHQREFIEWITEGKPKNWKYVK